MHNVIFIMVGIDKRTSQAIDFGKLLLLMGVVLLHCNLNHIFDLPQGWGTRIVDLLSTEWLHFRMPVFFILSGFLFFNNLGKFEIGCFKEKLYRRIWSLLVPYMIWCMIYTLARLAGGYFAESDFAGAGGDGLDWLGLARGFWDEGNGYPVGYVLWYIRNLMVFCVLSPIVYFIARSWWLTLIVIIVSLLPEVEMHGFQYFTLGAFLAMQGVSPWGSKVKHGGKICVLAVVLLSIFLPCAGRLENTVNFVSNILGLHALLRGCVWFVGNVKGWLFAVVESLTQAKFFIYCSHAIFGTHLARSVAHVTGLSSDWLIVTCYVLTFLLTVGLCWLTFRMMLRVAPRMVALLTGRRALPQEG